MGGAEVFTREVAKRWVKAGNKVTLFTSEFHGCKREEVLDGIQIVRAGGRFGVYWNARRFYKRAFSKEGYDVVIDEINTRPFFAPKFVKNGEKVVALIHQLAREYWFYETPFPINYIGFHFLENRWLRNYFDVPTVTVSESTRRDLLNLGLKNIVVIPEGLSFEPLREVPEKEKHPVVAYTGRLKKAKRPDHAIRAFRVVKKIVPDAELWILGEGPFRSDLERMAGDGVKFFGGLSDEERRERVGRSWVLVNPSVREGWGLNVTEANAMGTPCVAYDVPGLRDNIKNGETGILAEAGNVGHLAKDVVAILIDRAPRKRLSENALAYSKRFDWNISAEEFEEALKRALRDKQNAAA
jgi:glycosyltransferase involved in cell wall biosynthesis